MHFSKAVRYSQSWTHSAVSETHRSYDSCRLNLSLASRFRLMPASAASRAKCRCNSGGTRTMNFPLKLFEARGSGTVSPLACISATASATTCRIPLSAFSGASASQLRPGNSTQRPTYSLSSSDHVTRYVYRSFCNIVLLLQAINRLQHLPDLIGLCHSFVILNIDSWVTLPGCFINSMTTTLMPGLAKEGIAYPTEVIKTNSFWISSHLGNQIFNFRHNDMIPLLILLSRVGILASNTRLTVPLAAGWLATGRPIL